jgi:hypothetical protein
VLGLEGWLRGRGSHRLRRPRRGRDLCRHTLYCNTFIDMFCKIVLYFQYTLTKLSTTYVCTYVHSCVAHLLFGLFQLFWSVYVYCAIFFVLVLYKKMPQHTFMEIHSVTESSPFSKVPSWIRLRLPTNKCSFGLNFNPWCYHGASVIINIFCNSCHFRAKILPIFLK